MKLTATGGPALVVPGRRVKVAILSSFTVDPIKAYLQVDCLERGVWADVFIPSFNQFQQEILSPDSDLYKFTPDICFLHVQPDALLGGVSSGELSLDDVEPLVDAVRGLIQTFRDHSNADLVVSNFASPDRFPNSLNSREAADVYRQANDLLRQLADEVPGVQVLDYDGLTAFHGKSSVADPRLRHIARMDIGDKFLPTLASKMQAYALAVRGLGRKCIVVDLDNTLWGGIVGEDGPDGIHLGPDFPGSAFVEFQHTLLSIKRRGILLAISSKNNEQDALEVLEGHPAMVLQPEDFAASRINWLDKYQNIESIADELNIGLESMVFIDDNPVEREMMHRLSPEVLTPEWPVDPVDYRAAIESLPDFETSALTEEDRNRSAMYANEKEREQFKTRSASLESYLHGLKLELMINEVEESDIPRVHQLFNKTNQFNLTTRRYSLAEVQGFRDSDDAALFVMRNRDTFGDNGLVGIALALRDAGAIDEGTWIVDSYLMSCRVLGRTVEQGFLSYILKDLKSRGGRSVIGKFISTAKNDMVQGFYADAGFTVIDADDEGERWSIDLTSFTPPSLPWLAINPVRVDASH